MPFVVVKRGDRWCCYTQAEGGGPAGDPHGCHDTREEALAQQRALYANVPEARKADKPTGSQGSGEHYADPGYQDDKQPRYPVTKNGTLNADRVRAAWSYIHQADNRRLYSAEQLSHIEGVIRAAAGKVGVELSDGKSEDGAWIAFGSACKTLGDGKIGGYLVQWGGPADADADGEWFSPETDFDTAFPATTSVYYNHGLDPKWGRKRITRGAMKLAEGGIEIEAQLDLSNADQARLYRKVAAGEMGWSSGTASHITDPPRTFPGGAIRYWPLGIDASITRTPSDRRNVAMALKSWAPPAFDDMPEGRLDAAAPSLAEALERAADEIEAIRDRVHGIAVKAGRKLSAARRERIARLRDELSALLDETEPPPATRPGEPSIAAAEAAPDDAGDLEALMLATIARANGVLMPAGVSQEASP